MTPGTGSAACEVRPLVAADRPWASALVADHFASSRVVSRGVLHEADALPGLVAYRGVDRVGLLLYDVRDDERHHQMEVVVLVALSLRSGVGRQLLQAAAGIGRNHGCRRLWLVTTNDNAGAIAFYRAVGWRQVAVHEGAVEESRKLKPEIPLETPDGVPIRDEIEFEIDLD